ncbi:hypothetical protein D3C80_1622610 [compost metagenome]
MALPAGPHRPAGFHLLQLLQVATATQAMEDCFDAHRQRRRLLVAEHAGAVCRADLGFVAVIVVAGQAVHLAMGFVVEVQR